VEKASIPPPSGHIPQNFVLLTISSLKNEGKEYWKEIVFFKLEQSKAHVFYFILSTDL
jgi:hypothetical protein